ncbi:hypothetical protein FOZ61_006334 [Perkinsus olseni]|uniref:Uncharacterized protein n=1 Tax=Perkinsus olseni TaxID=32597 RepID=A0A7J6MA68_PEROL|nr:hypothetical protein FOZ61_006334 [Perkinsus olseni]
MPSLFSAFVGKQFSKLLVVEFMTQKTRVLGGIQRSLRGAKYTESSADAYAQYMNHLGLVLLGYSVFCHAGDLEGVEWLYGKGLSGNRYYLSPESNGRNPVVRIKNTGKKAGPFTDIYRYLAGYAKKPKGPVRYATVYAVSEDSRQTSYKVAVNSHLGRPPCFSEADFIADDNDVLKEINHIGRNGGFQLLKAGHDPHLAGRYFGAMDSERSVELEIEGGVPVNASLTGINSTSLSFMPVDTLFVYAELEDPEKNNLVLPLRGAGESNLRGNKRIFCSNLAEWNSAVDRETSRFDVIMTE